MVFARVYEALVGVGRCVRLLGETLHLSWKELPAPSLILQQCFDIGVLSLPVVAITGFSTGCVLAAQAFYQLGDKGLGSVAGLIVGKSMLTEVGPVLTAFMVTGRVGSSMCAVIGTMRVTEQIDALKSMAVNPLRYLIAPRIMGSVAMMPLLTIFSAIMGILGGFLISVYVFHMTPQGYFDPMPLQITLFDFLVGMIKALFFGFLIGAVACYKGITTTGGAAGVGKAITQSVVTTYAFILILNFVLTVGLNVIHTALKERYLI